MTRTRPLAVGVTPMETRRDVIREVAVHARAVRLLGVLRG